jgi:glutamine cyclotransferase
MIFRSFILIIIAVLLMVGCDSDQKERTAPEVRKSATSIKIANDTKNLMIGEEVRIQVIENEAIQVDSVRLFINDSLFAEASEIPFEISWQSTDGKTGFNLIRAIIYKTNGEQEVIRANVRLLSDVEPEAYTYRIVEGYPHDNKAYTQGLIYLNGFFYESTGHKGESSLRKVDINTGKVLKIEYLPSQYFGEGLCYLNGNLVQLTWKAGIAFIYDVETFTKKGEFRYPTEGWGLTSWNGLLVMSDGSSTLHFIDPATYTEKYSVEVYNQVGPVSDLNELETVNGMIYANVYTTDEVVMIDPENGKITGVIDFSGLEEAFDQSQEVDVLNGIAYDEMRNRLFVTGKWWPRIFLVDIYPAPITALTSAQAR